MSHKVKVNTLKMYKKKKVLSRETKNEPNRNLKTEKCNI